MEKWVKKLLVFLAILYLVILSYLLWMGCVFAQSQCDARKILTLRALLGIITAGLPAWIMFLIALFAKTPNHHKKSKTHNNQKKISRKKKKNKR